MEYNLHKNNLSNKLGVFIHIPKAAGSSIYKSLQPDIIRYTKHCTALFIKNDLSDNEWDRLYKVTWIRNPWQRVVSLWKYTKKVGLPQHSINDFKVWLFDPKVDYHCQDEPYNRSPLTALTYVSDLEGNIIVDFIGRLEYINEDVEKLNKELNKNFRVLHENNRNLGKNYKEYYDDESSEYIADKSKWEIEKFGYKF